MRAPVISFKRARRLRRELTFPEVLLWQCLRNGGVGGAHFRKQHPCGPFILDFYCSAAKLGVEIDGAAHDAEERALKDISRDLWLADKGIKIMRFPASDVIDGRLRLGVLETIAVAVGSATS